MRAVIAEDSVLLREGVARLLEESGIAVAAQSGNADDLLLHVRSYEPDVAIVDVRMPPTHTDEGARAARTIRERHPDVAVLVL
jgi:DNA-binding NarL/FixJ family response regulator